MQSAVRFTRLNNLMRASKRSRTFILAILFCAAASFNGCGRKETAPFSDAAENSSASTGAKLAELPLDLQTEQKLDPLTKKDVELYLKVMRAAAERVKNPTQEDQTAINGAIKILAEGTSGRVPTHDEVKTLERANLVAIAMDQIVAEEMNLDGRTYRGIVEAIESVVPNPASGAPSDGGGEPAPDHAPTQLEKRLSAVNAANERFLAPYSDEIQKLIAVVRNPANLPK
jgi:hypothetical protein